MPTVESSEYTAAMERSLGLGQSLSAGPAAALSPFQQALFSEARKFLLAIPALVYWPAPTGLISVHDASSTYRDGDLRVGDARDGSLIVADHATATLLRWDVDWTGRRLGRNPRCERKRSSRYLSSHRRRRAHAQGVVAVRDAGSTLTTTGSLVVGSSGTGNADHCKRGRCRGREFSGNQQRVKRQRCGHRQRRGPIATPISPQYLTGGGFLNVGNGGTLQLEVFLRSVIRLTRSSRLTALDRQTEYHHVPGRRAVLLNIQDAVAH